MKPIFPESPQEWISAPPNKIYYNSKTKRYTATIIANTQVIPEKDLLSESREYYPDFVKNVLLNLNKVQDDIDTLVNSVEVENNFIDAAALIPEKLLLSIPESVLKDVKENPDLDTSEYETISYTLSTFFVKILQIANKFQDYQTQMVSDIYKNSVNILVDTDFLMESDALSNLSSNIPGLIESNNVDIVKYGKIEISYDSEYSIRCVKLIDDIDSYNLKYLFSDFRKSYPQNRRQTTELLYNLSSLSEDIKSSLITYENIIYSYLSLSTSRRENSINLSARSASKGTAAATKNRDTTKDFDSLKNISKKSVGILQKEILNSVYRTPCMTPEERDRINQQLEESSGKKANFANKLSLSVNDAFFENLPEVLQKIADQQGKEALNDLGTNLLNRLGVCGIGDLTSLVTNTVFAYMNEQEYADELSKCAVQNLNNDKVSTLWTGLQKLGKNAEITEKYRKFVGDTIPPWNTGGYVPPDYRKSLATDNPLTAQYTLKVKTTEKDTDIDFRFVAFKDSIAASVDGTDLLNILVNTFPDEMGWLSFFTDMTKGILNKCKVPMPSAGVSFNANWCQKRVEWPKLRDVPKSNSSFSFKPSTISTILVEEIKNTIINLTVRTVIASMRQVFEIISAGASIDSDYFKENQFIPDLFQNNNDIQYQIADYCGDASPNYKKTNESVREIFYEQYRKTSETNKMSLEDIDSFLKSCSIALSRYDKIRLYNGEAPPTTYNKILALIRGTPVSVYLANYADVEQTFLRIGQLLDSRAIEDQFYDSVRSPTPPSIGYCGDSGDPLSAGYFQNKPDITPTQVERMKEVLKEIQKDKICFAVEALGNPNGVIIGQLGEAFKSKTGPVFGRISEEMGKLFEPIIEQKIETICKNYRNDLYTARGLFDLILVNENGIGKNRRDISSFFGALTILSGSTSMQNSKVIESQYSPDKNFTNITLRFEGGGDKPSIEYEDSNGKITLPSKKSMNIKTSQTSGEFETGANKIEMLLVKNQDLLPEDLNRKLARNFIKFGVLGDITDTYFKDLISKISSKRRTYGSNWIKIYETMQKSETAIPALLGEEVTVKDTKMLYGLLDNFPENYKYAPFNALKSKEEAALAYSSFSMLVHTVTSEILLKSLPIYEALGSNLLNEYELIGEYIYRKFENTIDDYSNDKRRLKVLEKLVQITLLASNEGLIPPLPSRLNKNIDNINVNIKNWINGSRGGRAKNLEKNEKDIEEVARFFVNSISRAYIRQFQVAMREIEGNTFPSIKQTNEISKYIFDDSIMPPLTNVVKNTNKVGPLEYGLRFEKYIILKGASVDLPSGVQNLEEFKNYLSKNTLEGSISDNWSSWSFGMRISSVFDFGSAGISFTDIPLHLRQQIKGFSLVSDSALSEPIYYFLSPLVVYEKEIPDQPISINIIDDYDEDSMKNKLSEINDFLNFYYRGMNIENLMSLATIYINEEFGTFLTNKNPNPIVPSTVDLWKNPNIGKKKKILNDTKRFIVNTLERI